MNGINISEELRRAALALGECMHTSEVVADYLEKQMRVQADAEVSALEAQLTSEFEKIVTRQRAGELLSQEEIDAFYALRSQVYTHPLVFERDAAFKLVKSYFVEVATEISNALGLDYPRLAVPHSFQR